MREKEPSLRVVEAVAEAEESDPGDLSTPLASVIDPDALDRLFETAGYEGMSPCCSVSFTYYGYDVNVNANGRITVQ
ncbi:HalOD1 output domain-containing protein [Natranaeroarchaeum aerophilus]|uniref:Halobacterial output domain-containing protein n=1 Tax=Natranaeroarchaeum aerophilus TaxID=2917711 RepID=A0AAE3FSX0_9EURY|nr:HalOD1 output domain-containing protein [Natranaeroarchaeum aerophilus]MCL9814545.1 hypothetical protein [Natranaeroarchaeum aerophilus]